MYKRKIQERVLRALKDTPVVMIVGARQTGKTTLVRSLAEGAHPARYLALDDLSVRGTARSDPHGFLSAIPGPAIIDEIQLVADLLPAIKLEVDRRCAPGRFLITGSAHVLALPRIAESLAGRMETIALHPLSQGELTDQPERFVDRVFEEDWGFPPSSSDSLRPVWPRVIQGGFPEVQERADPARRNDWFENYVQTILQRDVRELSNIEALTEMPRLLRLLATRVGGMLNHADLSRTLQMPQTSLRRYVALFESIYLVYRLPPWSGNLGKRLVKTPKLYFTDTGLAASLTGITDRDHPAAGVLSGLLLENFVVSELLRQATWSALRPGIFFLRRQTGQEVDVVLEDRRGRCVMIEIKAAATLKSDDAAGIRSVARDLGDRFLRGIVLYTGREVVPFAPDVQGLPLSAIWTTP